MHYFPVAWPVLVLLAALLLVVVVLIELKILYYAASRTGIHPRYILLGLAFSFICSYINIPVARLGDERILSDQVVVFYGVPYIVPVAEERPGTIIAINVGGALIPTLIALYLMAKNRIYVRSILAIAVVAFITHLLARPVRGVGICIPIFIPPLAAALVAIVLSWRRAQPLAYIAGSLGTLIGADLLNLGSISGLGAPIASIGGAGIFDGVFLSGVIAVLLPPGRMDPGPVSPERSTDRHAEA